MSPAFASWPAFFAMGGYAVYVWLAVGVTLLSLFGLIGHTCWQRHHLLGDIRRRQARMRRMRQGRAGAAPHGQTAGAMTREDNE
ncbi:heme exporter protein CcmD [Sodalis sp. RH21]|uniref:heme exporter protein CcmD n=1 Tax=unclassified Sodalis (in: enterobacteria) TaxID=2636512 RepID=UPI0039B630F3